MAGRVSMALLMAMLIGIQPVLAQDSVTTIYLEDVTDEELTGALDAATELELIMRGDWDVGEVDAPAEEPVIITEAEAEEPELTAEEEPVFVVEVEEPEIPAEEPAFVTEAEAEEPEVPVEEPVLVTEVGEEEPELPAEDPVFVAEAEEEEADIPEGIRDNEYFIESRRLVGLAEEAYDRGDYEAAAIYAQEASRYALLSDEYIARQMEAEAIAEAEEVGAEADDGYPLPATFTVRSWATYRDSLWTIAGRPEVYGDPRRWPTLFNANRHRMPDPNNPDLILPGMVLEIPSIDGEAREGAWQADREYRR